MARRFGYLDRQHPTSSGGIVQQVAKLSLPSPVMVLPGPADPVADLVLPDYDPLREQRYLERQARQLIERYLSGQLWSPHLDRLYGPLLAASVMFNAHFLYLISQWQNDRDVAKHLNDSRDARLPKQPATPDAGLASAPTEEVPRPAAAAQPSVTLTQEDLERKRISGLRCMLTHLASELRAQINAAEKARLAWQRLELKVKNGAHQLNRLEDALRAARDVEGELRTLLTPAYLENVERVTAKLQREIQALVQLQEKASQPAPARVPKGSVNAVPPGLTHLAGNLYAEIAPQLLTSLAQQYGDQVAALFVSALENGLIAAKGTGESGVKKKSEPELKVRRDKLLAYQAPPTLRLRGRYEQRDLGGRIIEVIVFFGTYEAH
jgi:hypothetical protein